MGPKRTKKQSTPSDPDGIFAGMVVFLVEDGVQPRRLQIWKQKLEQMGASIEQRMSKKVTHVFAMNSDALLKQIGRERLSRFGGSVLLYKWLEDSLTVGEKVSEAPFVLALESGAAAASSKKSLEEIGSKPPDGHDSSDVETPQHKRIRTSSEDHKTVSSEDTANAVGNDAYSGSDDLSASLVSVDGSPSTPDSLTKTNGTSNSSLPHSPPDQNQNITEIFGKLMNIYRALGDDRRSFSYHKAIAVIEKLPFEIDCVDQVKHLPAIGKSMQDHIQEIVNTGKLSKLEHFETDEKVRTISLFGEVWGIGPATALKLYEKGHRTLEDLKNEDSLTSSQRLGLKYFDDIKTRIPRLEVQEMELLLRNAAEGILPGVIVVCGGSYRRGKASCGDLDVVITHPDGKSHVSQEGDKLHFLELKKTHCANYSLGIRYLSVKLNYFSHIGFLRKYVKHLKDLKFLREDLVFSIHSEEGSDAGVDTYFGLCTYPGRELRHRIDIKVYPRDIYAFGLIAWTGNDVLNRRLRLLAESKGYRLDDTGLFPATKSSSSKRGTKASLSLHFKTEKEVFDFLGFPCLEPHERNL